MASQYVFEAIGTHWQIDIYQDISLEQQQALETAIRQRIAVFDKDYSRFREDSLVTAMSHNAGDYTLPEDALALFVFYKQLYDLTDGLVTPLVGNLLSDAGYDAQYSLQQKKALSAPPSWQEALAYDHPKLTITQPVLLDVGAAGKGYLIDIVALVLEAHGISAYCVDAGGDMIHRNTSPIRVGLEDPGDTSKVIGVATLQNKSLCGSAGNRRAWGNMHHIIDPVSLQSPTTIRAVWVLAETTMLADGLTTALFFVSPEALSDVFSFEYLIVRDDYSVEQSSAFPAALFGVLQ